MKKVFSAVLTFCIILTCCVAGLTSITASAADSDFEIYDGILVEYIGDAETVTIPSSVKEIDSRAFFENETLVKVKIPEGVTKIGGRAFEGCTSLEEVNIPFSVKEMGDCVFRNCTSLSSIAFPSNLKKIPGDTCAGCVALTDVTISYGVKKIEYYAFDSTPISKIVIPESVEHISGLAFANLTSDAFSVYVCNPLCDMSGYTEYMGEKKNVKQFFGPVHIGTICSVYCIEGSPALTQAKAFESDKYIVYPMTLDTAKSFPENQKTYGIQNVDQAKELAGTIKTDDADETENDDDDDVDEDTDKDTKKDNKKTSNDTQANDNTLIIVIIIAAAALIVIIVAAVVLVIVLTSNKKKKKKKKKKVAPKPVEEVTAPEEVTETVETAEEVTPVEEVTPSDEENGTEE